MYQPWRILRTGAVLQASHGYGAPNAIAVDGRTRRVFVANYALDSVAMLDARTGKRLRAVQVGRFPVALAVDERRNRVIVLGEGGTVVVLDAGTGRLQRELHLALGGNLEDVQVDSGSGHILVVSWGDDQVPKADALAWLPSAVRHWPLFPAFTPGKRTLPPSVTILNLDR